MGHDYNILIIDKHNKIKINNLTERQVKVILWYIIHWNNEQWNSLSTEISCTSLL